MKRQGQSLASGEGGSHRLRSHASAHRPRPISRPASRLPEFPRGSSRAADSAHSRHGSRIGQITRVGFEKLADPVIAGTVRAVAKRAVGEKQPSAALLLACKAADFLRHIGLGILGGAGHGVERRQVRWRIARIGEWTRVPVHRVFHRRTAVMTANAGGEIKPLAFGLLRRQGFPWTRKRNLTVANGKAIW